MKSYWTLNSAQMAAVNSDPAVMAAIARIHAIQDAFNARGNFESEEDGETLKADVELAVHDYEKLLRETVETMFGDFDEPIWSDAPALTGHACDQLALLVSDSKVACRLAQADLEAAHSQVDAAEMRLTCAFNLHHDLTNLLDSMNTKEASK